MKAERFICFICMQLAAVAITDAQESDTSRVYNGWHVEPCLSSNWFHYTYYMGTKDDYISIEFNRDRKRIDCIDMHFTGEMSKMSQLFYFLDDGKLDFKLSNFEEYSIPIRDKDGNTYHPDRICYGVSYWENGKVKAEGPILYYEEDGPVMDTCAEHGEYKFYNEKGELTEIRYYYNSNMVFSVKLGE